MQWRYGWSLPRNPVENQNGNLADSGKFIAAAVASDSPYGLGSILIVKDGRVRAFLNRQSVRTKNQRQTKKPLKLLDGKDIFVVPDIELGAKVLTDKSTELAEGRYHLKDGRVIRVASDKTIELIEPKEKLNLTLENGLVIHVRTKAKQPKRGDAVEDQNGDLVPDDTYVIWHIGKELVVVDGFVDRIVNLGKLLFKDNQGKYIFVITDSKTARPGDAVQDDIGNPIPVGNYILSRGDGALTVTTKGILARVDTVNSIAVTLDDDNVLFVKTNSPTPQVGDKVTDAPGNIMPDGNYTGKNSKKYNVKGGLITKIT